MYAMQFLLKCKPNQPMKSSVGGGVHSVAAPILSSEEERLLSLISTSGRFTLANSQKRYASVKRVNKK